MKLEPIRVAENIENKIKALELGRDLLKERGPNKAQAIADYDKAMAKILIQLKNGVEMTLEGEIIKDPPASVMEKIAKGLCYKEKFAVELAEIEYKNAVVGMEALEAELNGWQSINRFLDTIT